MGLSLSNFSLAFLAVSLSSVLLLGIVVLLQNWKKAINQVFFILCLSASIWALSVIMTFFSSDHLVIIATARLAFGASSILLLSIYFFAVFFPEITKRKFIHIISIIWLFGGLFLSIASVATPWLVKDVIVEGMSRVRTYGSLQIIFAVYYVASLFGSIVILLLKRKNALKAEKDQIVVVLLGYSIATAIGFITNLLAPLLISNATSFSKYGPFAIIFFVGSTLYAMARRQLFNINIIATEFLAFLLFIFLFFRIFLSGTYGELIYNIIIAALGIVLGILLIRSVIQEVRRREEVERLNRQLSDFLRFGNHELRSPLGGIRGYTSMILDGTYGKLSAPLTKTMKIIQVQVDHLLLLVETFLNANRARSGNLEINMEQVDVVPTLLQTIGTLQSSAELKGLQLNVDLPKSLPKVNVDPRKLQVVVGNILSNAVKYTQKGSITVKANTTDGHVAIKIVDTGIGIPKDVQPHLFTQFERGTKRAKKMATGSGIGLYLTKKLMDAMDGDIKIKSPGPEKGSTATLTFKRAKEPLLAKEGAATAPAALHKG